MIRTCYPSLRRVAALWASLSCVASVLADVPGPLELRSERLGNGMMVSVCRDPAMPIIATQIWIHVGGAHEEEGTRGFAHLFEHLMFGGTKLHDKAAYALLHERFGGSENAYTAFDETVYLSEVAPAGHDDVLLLEADRLVHLALTEDNLANEKRIVTEELRLRLENDPVARIGVEALKRVLGAHPYAVSPIGTKEEIGAATLDLARDFYRRYYGPGNAHLVIVGPVSVEATLARVRDLFGAIPDRTERAREIPAVTDWPMERRVALRGDIPPVEIAVLGYPLPPADHADQSALEVLGEVLGGGAVDPLREALVTRRSRAIEAGTMLVGLRRAGVLALYSASLPYRRERTAFRDIERERERWISNGVLSDARIESAKLRLVRRKYAQRYFAAEVAAAIGAAHWWEGDPSTALTRTSRVEAVTPKAVRAAFQRYVLDARPVRAYIKPQRVPWTIRLFGWLYPLFA